MSDSNRFFRGVFRTTNRFSFGSDAAAAGGSRIETAFLTLPNVVERSGIWVFGALKYFLFEAGARSRGERAGRLLGGERKTNYFLGGVKTLRPVDTCFKKFSLY